MLKFEPSEVFFLRLMPSIADAYTYQLNTFSTFYNNTLCIMAFTVSEFSFCWASAGSVWQNPGLPKLSLLPSKTVQLNTGSNLIRCWNSLPPLGNLRCRYKIEYQEHRTWKYTKFCICALQYRQEHWGATEKNAWTREADQVFFKSTPDSCFVLLKFRTWTQMISASGVQ